MYCHKTTWKVEQVRIFFSSGANNLIPMEIALKIADKIRAHERFAAYIVIPMWPEGNPTGAATQRILFWQVIPFMLWKYLSMRTVMTCIHVYKNLFPSFFLFLFPSVFSQFIIQSLLKRGHFLKVQ